MRKINFLFHSLLQRIDEAIEEVSERTDQLPKPSVSTPEQEEMRRQLNERYAALHVAYGEVARAQKHYLASPDRLQSAIDGLKKATAEAQKQVDAMTDLAEAIEAARKIIGIVRNVLPILT